MLERKTILFGTIIVALFTIEIGFSDESFAASNDLILGTVISSIASTTQFESSSEYVTINLDVYEYDEININIFNETMTFTNTKTTSNDVTNTTTWKGQNDAGRVVLVFGNDVLYGSVMTLENTYYIHPESDDVHIVEIISFRNLENEEVIIHQVDPPLTTSSQEINSIISALDISGISNSDADLMDLIATAYDGDKDYGEYNVEIDVYVAFSERVGDEEGSSSSYAQYIIEKANDSMDNSYLPVSLNLAEFDELTRAFVEDTIQNDYDLMFNESYDDFDRMRAVAEDVDLTLLVSYYDITDEQPCGAVPASTDQLLVQSPEDAFTMVNYYCINQDFAIHALGHLMGAGHNKDYADNLGDTSYTNPDFEYGHGFYTLSGNPQRTIMSLECNNKFW